MLRPHQPPGILFCTMGSFLLVITYRPYIRTDQARENGPKSSDVSPVTVPDGPATNVTYPA